MEQIDSPLVLNISKELSQNIKNIENGYPLLNDPEFNIKIRNKKEFNEIYNKHKLSLEEANELDNLNDNLSFTLNSQQLFVRNFLSLNTPYNSLLLYHGLGTGKTCTSITVAMEKIKYMHNIGESKKILIVANPNVQYNFKKELFNESKLLKVNNEWRLLTCVGSDILKFVNVTNENIEKDKLISRINLFINEWFRFVGYTKFANIINEYIGSSKNDNMDNSLIIIDEIHNIRVSSDSKNKRIAETLVKLVKKTKNLQLLLLSATPMFDNYKEIIWLLNLMNINDERPIISGKEIFDNDGNFIIDPDSGEEIGMNKFIRKITGYVSFVKGEDPVNFPFRIYPLYFDKKNSIINMKYPTIQFDNKEIIVPLKHTDIYTIKLNNYQENVYNYVLNNINLSKTDDEIELKLGYQIFQLPLNILNICYPCEYFDNIQTNNNTIFNKKNIVDSIGKNALTTIFGDISKLPFEYDKDYTDQYNRIFSIDEIEKYSAKIHSICSNISKSEGISLIYSEKIYSGVLPTALTLEEMGYSRYNGNNLLNNKKKSKLKYVMITGNSLYSPNNKLEIDACINDNNVNGEKVKVIIISRAGSEGIDLKYIRNIHILEPWYNMNRTEQVIGRGIRNKSHIKLPFEKRNVCIYMYGSILNNKEYESIDLYIYRLAEEKSLKIGKISRILKETSIDCLLTVKENIRYFKDNIQEVKQILSNKNEIQHNINHKPFSNFCDYMETCNYDCKIFDNEYKKINLITNDDITTYNKHNNLLNTNDIIIKIKDLFKEKYFYTKFDIINRICVNKTYSIDVINTALNELLNNSFMVVFDRYSRKGKIVNINDLYLFQPIEISNDLINYEERIRPIDYKNDKILIKMNNKQNNEILDLEEETIVKFIKDIMNYVVEIQYIINGNFHTDILENHNKEALVKLEIQRKKKEDKKNKAEQEAKRKEEEKQKKYEEKMKLKNDKILEKERQKQQAKEEKERLKLQKQGKNMKGGQLLINSITLIEFIEICTEIIFDKLSIQEKIYLINKLYLKNKDKYIHLSNENINVLDIFNVLDSYITNNIIKNEKYSFEIIILGYTNKLNFISLIDNEWKEGSNALLTLFTPDIKELSTKYKKFSNYGKFLGINNYIKNKSIFKIKDTTNTDVHNSGARCKQMHKPELKKILNEITDNIDEINTLMSYSKYKIDDICNIIEFILRFLHKNSDDKIWFLDSIQSGIIKSTNIIKI